LISNSDSACYFAAANASLRSGVGNAGHKVTRNKQRHHNDRQNRQAITKFVC